MLKLFLWLKYLRKRKIVFLSIAAVALSVALLLVVTSLFTSFINMFENSAVNIIGDVAIIEYHKFASSSRLIEKLEQLPEVKSATVILTEKGLLHLGTGNVRAVSVWGIDASKRAEVVNFKQTLLIRKNLPGLPTFGTYNPDENINGYVGIGVIAEPNEHTDEYDISTVEKAVGSKAYLTMGTVTQQGDGGTNSAAKFKRKVIEFVIADVVNSGIYDIDKNYIYLPIEELQKKLYPNAQGILASEVQIKLKDSSQAEASLLQIRNVWEKFAVDELGWSSYQAKETEIATAKQLQAKYVVELKKQMGALLVIFGIISFSVIMLVFCIFYMIVETRRKDIAIIKSCGATDATVAAIFLGFGACVGFAGSIIGTAVGYYFTKKINAIEEIIRIVFGLKLWKSSTYMFSTIPNSVDWDAVWYIAAFAIAAAVAGAIVPAITAFKTKPVNILRYE